MRDDFYQHIISALQGPLDADLFEHCACDLLRSAYPTLAPIKGGSDSGMDGAIADGLGEPFPMVCTTDVDVLRNLTRSLKSYVAHGGQRRKAVLATSRPLTPLRKRNLSRRASELGFQLINIHDQTAMADLLYHSPEWCRDLLGITGNPPALSVVPLTVRPLLDQPLVGRKADLEWLRSGTGDKLLLGQPGSGKTFLLYKLAREGRGLFVVDRDRGTIAAAIRAQQPCTLIIDDAHTNTELLMTLLQMRAELGIEFSILASSWPGERATIADLLGLSSSSIHELEPLDRDQIVEVIHGAGIGGPDRLIGEIVDQSDGRPGLAVTLAHLCLQGGVRDVALGDALSGSLLRFLTSVVGSRAKFILAAFALGGDAGMSCAAVASETRMNLVNLTDLTSKLAAGGVILQTRTGCLAVRPRALRHALVRDVFFGEASSMPIDGLLARAEDESSMVLELIAARGRGAAVQDSLLVPRLESLDWSKTWEAYAALGRREVLSVLRTHPELVIAVAHPALHYAPELAIPLLLSRAVGDDRQLHAWPEHPLRLIQDWVKEGYPGTDEATRRRQLVGKAAEDWLIQGKDSGVGFAALRAALTPHFERQSLDPGKGTKVTISFGGLAESDIAAIQGLWPAATHLVETLAIIDWKAVREIAEDWAYPGRINANLSNEVRLAMKSFAACMLRDIVRIGSEHPGILHWADAVAQRIDCDIQVCLDPVFETLYPQENLDDFRHAAEEQASIVLELACSWADQEPSEIAKAISRAEREAGLADVRWPRWTPLLCSKIAKATRTPTLWVHALMQEGLSPDLIEPFLLASSELREPEWPTLARECLASAYSRPAALSVLLTAADTPPEVLDGALGYLHEYAQLVKVLCLRAQVPPATLTRLLQHEEAIVAEMAALGMWHARDRIPVEESLRADWRKAVIKVVEEDYWLTQVFQEDPTLARDWLEARLSEGFKHSYRHDSGLKAAVSALGPEERSQLLFRLPDDYGLEAVVQLLVGDDLDLYAQLLRRGDLEHYHLTPLGGHPDDKWIAKAKLAIGAGYDADLVAHAAVWASPEGFSFWGSEAAVWSEWIERFEPLRKHDDGDIRAVGEAGKRQSTANRNRALAEERHEAIYGLR